MSSNFEYKFNILCVCDLQTKIIFYGDGLISKNFLSFEIIRNLAHSCNIIYSLYVYLFCTFSYLVKIYYVIKICHH